MKAISLLSGGLDSQLAVCVIKEQGVEVIGLNFKTPFFGADESTYEAARNLGIDFHTIDISRSYMGVLKNPVYGYGKHFNPCIDCHAFMLKNAGEYMHTIGASFLITGEVVGQRPMSQNKSALNAVNKLSGQNGLILRPLSAQLLPPTIPEIEGWVDRNRLLDISGRSRTRQMELAKSYGIIDYPTPAGGCLLTQENFSKRLKRFWEMMPQAPAEELEILKVGRHFYLEDHKLLVVGRNEAENKRIESLALSGDYIFNVTDRPGPLGLLRSAAQVNSGDLDISAAIVARYSDARSLPLAKVMVWQKEESNKNLLEVIPMPANQVPAMV